MILKLLENVAGDNSLRFDAPDRVVVRPKGQQKNWAEVETKTPESLKVTLAGPHEAVDMDQLSALGFNGAVQPAETEQAEVTLRLTELKHARSRKLKTFLKQHLQRTIKT